MSDEISMKKTEDELIKEFVIRNKGKTEDELIRYFAEHKKSERRKK